MSSRWLDLVDPSRAEVDAALPAGADPDVLEALATPSIPGREPRPLLEDHGSYVFGVLVPCSPPRRRRHRRNCASWRRRIGWSRCGRARRRARASTSGHCTRPTRPAAPSARSSTASTTTPPIRTSISSTPCMPRSTHSRTRSTSSGRQRSGSGSRSCATSFCTVAAPSRRRGRPSGESSTVGSTSASRNSSRPRSSGSSSIRTTPRPHHGGARPRTRSARRRSRPPPVEDRREPERGRQEAHRHCFARPRSLVHRRLLRTELRRGLPPRVLGARSLGRAHRRVDAHAARPLPLASLDLASPQIEICDQQISIA